MDQLIYAMKNSEIFCGCIQYENTSLMEIREVHMDTKNEINPNNAVFRKNER